jgi:hypothetical protein
MELGNILTIRHLSEDMGEVLKEVINIDVFRRDDEGIDVRRWTVDAQCITTKRVDRTPSIIDSGRW